MFLISTYLDKSPIHGIGVFANQFVPKGTKIWEFTPGFDSIFSEEALSTLLKEQRDIIIFYGYREPKIDQVVLSCDNARHFNFAVNPNTGGNEAMIDDRWGSYALRDIARGEELTYSVYEDLDAFDKLGPALYLQITQEMAP